LEEVRLRGKFEVLWRGGGVSVCLCLSIGGGDWRREKGREGEMGEEGGNIYTLVDDKTVFKRGKSDIPASSMEILLSRVVREERREETEEERSWEGVCVDIFFGGSVSRA
jgi:hypothetical protein